MAKASKKSAKPAPKAELKPAAQKKSLKTTPAETIVICEIRNLTQGRVITFADVANLSPADAYSATVSGAIASPGTLPATTDNIQVIWGVKGSGTSFSKRYRAVNGSMSYDDGKLTISGLKNVSKVSMAIKGVLDIGPVVETELEPVAHVSVSIGNMNQYRDWIINLSDQDNGEGPSYIKLNSLIDWVSKKVPGDDPIELPKGEGDETTATTIDPKNFTIMFNDFYLNITSKVFNFNVESKAGESITLGNFKINKVGFQITNEPYLPKEEDEDDEAED